VEHKAQLSVCPHDTAKNVVAWFLLNTYLQRHLQCDIHFEPQDNFLAERSRVLAGGFHVVFANPYSAWCFEKELGFTPVARPVGLFDETLLVARADGPLPAGSVKVASATDKLIVHALGLTLLPQAGFPPADCEFSFVGNHLKAAAAVIKGEADLGFVFNDTWRGMAETTRQQLRALGETRDGRAYHCFCVSPEWAQKRAQLQELLCSMHSEPKGQRILADLGFAGFEPLEQDALASLHALLQ